MKVYIDLVLGLNIWLDFLLLYAVSLVLKKETTIKRVFLSSLIGGITTFLLFFQLNKTLLFLIKLVISSIMLEISFLEKHLKSLIEDIVYFYLVSIILGGFIYLIKDNVNINSFKVNFLFLTFTTPCILYFYYKKVRKINNHYNHIYHVKLYYEDKVYTFKAFLDTGNKLYDPYKKRPIVLVYTDKIAFDYTKGILVPYETASGKSVMKCLPAQKIVIDHEVVKRNVIFGLAQDKFQMDDVDMILHSDLIGG